MASLPFHLKRSHKEVLRDLEGGCGTGGSHVEVERRSLATGSRVGGFWPAVCGVSL